MTSILNNPFKINGVVSTDKSVLDNLNELCAAASSWLTYDVSTGKWAVVINRAGNTSQTFNDSSIIGNIDITDTGVSDLYNSVSVEFPHMDLRDEIDYVDQNIDSNKLYPNEVPNNLTIRLNCINDPIQAQLIGRIELKQSRVGKIIKFRTDFSRLGSKAGDLIGVTASMYGFSNKAFRIIKLEEDDEDGIVVSITALEYDSDVYDDSDLVRTERTKANGIILASQNEAIKRSDDVDTGNQMLRLLAANAAAGLLGQLFKKLANGDIGPLTQKAKDIDSILGAAKRPDVTVSATSEICEGQVINVNLSMSCDVCLFDLPNFEYNYEIIGLEASKIDSMSINGEVVVTSLTGKIPLENGSALLTIDTKFDAAGEEESKVISIKIGEETKTVTINNSSDVTFTTFANQPEITEGQSAIITVNTTDVADGTLVPYTISGSATGKITNPLTGNLTINSNTASLTVITTDDSVYTGTQSFTFNVTPPGGTSPCGTYDLTASVNVLDNDSPPPPDVPCQYEEVPVLWCGTFDGTSGALKSVTPLKTALFPKPVDDTNYVELPKTLTVSGGAITVATTVRVSNKTNIGGAAIQVITTFTTPGADKIITGTTTTVYGL